MALFGGLFKSENTLFYPGCHADEEITNNYRLIMDKLGIKYGVFDKNFDCGCKLLAAGYEKEAIKQARKNLMLLKENKITKLLTCSPECYQMISEEYLKMLPDFDISVEFVLTPILNKLRSKLIRKQPLNDWEVKVTYHDPCYLGRYSGFYEEPREILSILGYEVVDMKYNRKFALCCGAGGLLSDNEPKLSLEVGTNRLMQAKETKTSLLVSACPLCATHFTKCLINSEIRDFQVMDISEVICLSLRIKEKKVSLGGTE